MTTYIGIDPGTKCGWAMLSDAGERIASGTWDLTARRHEGGGMRFLRLSKYLRALLEPYEVGEAVVGYEEVRRHAGVDAAHIYGGIIAVISQTCEYGAIAYAGIPVGTVKKHATGKGNSPKEAMIEAARQRWHCEPVDDNEADGLWIADALREVIA